MSTRTVLFAFSICLGIGGSRLCVAQPTVPKPPKAAPVPERIVPGAPTDPNKARIIGPAAPEKVTPVTGAGTSPEKVQIVPGSSTLGTIAPPGVNTPAAKVDPESLNQKGVTNRFVMALAQDKSGALWVGTEDEGVWRYDEKAPEAKRWKQFTTKDGLGDDNAYAVACDNQGRVWIGHLNHGISVFNGQSWKNYDVLDGPLGERIFDIAVAPTDGSVWIATSAGLTRYNAKKDDWTYYTRGFSGDLSATDWKGAQAPQNLPSDQIAALAFNARGDLFAGTQCDGLSIARAADDYKTWRVVRAGAPVKAASGQGLPSDLINDVLVAKSGTIYVATPRGLAFSSDGTAWRYLRGRDWEAMQEVAAAPTSNVAVSAEMLPREDFVTCLAQSAAGKLLIGYRQQGCEERAVQPSGALGAEAMVVSGNGLDFVQAILPTANKALCGFYGAGARMVSGAVVDANFQLPSQTSAAPSKIEVAPSVPKITPFSVSVLPIAAIVPDAPNAEAPAKPETVPVPVTAGQYATLPSIARPPSLVEMQAMLKQVSEVPADNDEAIKIVPLNDDWRTQGNCLDRYGRYSSIFCAVNGGGNDHVQGYWGAHVWHRGWIGMNRDKGDQLRYWVGVGRTEDTRALQFPTYGGRRFAEHDDHGETYPATQDGPHIYETLRVPKGRYVLSAYFVNDDGHGVPNSWRDYSIDVRPTPMDERQFNDLGFKGSEAPETKAEQAFNGAKINAKSRVGQFWGGVYKRFFVEVNDTTYLTMRINRNHSFNTIVSGIFLDPIGEVCIPGFCDVPTKPRRTLLFANQEIAPDSEADVAIRLMDRLLALRDTNPVWYTAQSRSFLMTLLRRFFSKDLSGNFLAKQIDKTVAYPAMRSDLAACLNDIQQFALRDRVSFSETHYESWRWKQVSELYREFNGDPKKIYRADTWDWDKYNLYVAQEQAKQSWQ